jgi:uncharacterized protein (DUF885 family)
LYVPDFSSLVDEFLQNEFETSPTLASSLGLTQYDNQLDDLSAAAFEKRNTDAVEWLKRFEDASDDGLDRSDEIDRQLAIASLRGRVINIDWRAWKRDPLLYSGPILNGVFYLFLNRLRPNTELVEAAVSRLEQAPAALEHGRANLDAKLANRLIVERAMNSARAGATYVRAMVSEEADTDSDRDQLRAAGAIAGDAFDQYAGFLSDLAEQAEGDWQYGEERYSRQLQDRERLNFDTRSLRDLGQREYDRLDAEMNDLARKVDGSGDWRKVLEAANEDHPRTEEEMRRSYADWTERSRAFLAETGLVTLPDGESCSVEPSPPFTRPLFAVASYSGPPAFSDTLKGHFFVPIAPDGTTEEEIQKRLASNSFGSIPTVAVHEAYPGHHWHIMWSKIKAPRLRAVLTTPFFSEGWALYAERVMRERGFFTDPIQELYHLEATIFRAARIVVDTSLHTGEMSHDEAVEFMLTKTALTEPTAKAEVGRYCSWPTQASSYLTGCLEILRMRERYLAARGVEYRNPADIPLEVLRDFHDTLAGSGKMPLGLAEEALMSMVPARV